MKFLIVLIIAGIAAFGAWRAYAQPGAIPSIGTAAPDFTLPAQDGHPISLHDYRGRWIVLYFYPRDFTSGCTIEAHGFQTNLPKYEAHHAVIIGVSVDSAQKHQDFCAKEGLNFKLLSDAGHDVSARYGSLNKLGPVAMSARHTFIVDPEGKIAAVFGDVKPATHSAEVLARLDVLQKK